MDACLRVRLGHGKLCRNAKAAAAALSYIAVFPREKGCRPMPDEPAQEESPEFHRQVAEAAVKVALLEAESHVFETDNDNRGPRVDEYQMVNKTLHQAWCAKFVYWCFMQAALGKAVANPFPRIFAAGALEKWGTKEKRMVTDPTSGDVLVRNHNHVGLVIGPAVAGTVPSVEGNTYAGTNYANRKEGVYKLNSTKVRECTFLRL